MIVFTLHSTASLPSVLAALHAHAGEWRESQIPDDLRRAGILGVECTIRESVCRLRYVPSSSRTGRSLELTATVAANPTGGSLIEVRVGYRALSYLATILIALFGAFAAWLFAATPLAVVAPVMVGGMLALHFVHVRQSNAALLRRERQPAYLIERLESAVAAAGAPRVNPPASTRRAAHAAAPMIPSPQDRKALFLIIAALVMGVILGTWDVAEDMSEQRAHRDLLRAVSHASMVVVNGQPLRESAVALAALRGIRHVPSHHSGPTAPIHVELRDGQTSTPITIARDSDRPNEFWVYLPGANWHNNALGRDAGRMISGPLGTLLHDRGL